MSLKIKSLLLIISFLIVCCTKNKKVEKLNKQTKPIFSSFKEGRIATDGGLSRGVAWGDYDDDGDPDLYVANSKGQWNALYRNNGNGKFKKITDLSRNAIAEIVIHGGNSQGVNWVDYDNDGDLDLYVVSRREEANFLFRNENNTEFTRIFDSPLTAPGISASMACWADIDGDGDLDVLLAGYGSNNLVFKNLGDGQFEKVKNNPLNSGEEGRARACACGDVNDDGLPEFYIANARRPNFYFKNLGNWKFKKVKEGHAVTDIGYSYGVSWADYDDDGDLDLFVANFDKENFLYNNNGQGDLIPVTDGVLALEKGGASKGHSWGDYDNDGDLDLYIANGTYAPNMHNFLYLNNGDGSFKQNFEGELKKHADTSAGVAHADFDRDGDLDIFVANWGSSDQVNRFYENLTENQNWISIRLKGKTSNKYGIGAKVQIFITELNSVKQLSRWMYPVTGYGSQNDYELHFGLGNVKRIDSLSIQWPSGDIDIHKKTLVNKHWIATQNGELVIGN